MMTETYWVFEALGWDFATATWLSIGGLVNNRLEMAFNFSE